MSCRVHFLPVPKSSALSQRQSGSLVSLETAKAAPPIIFPHPNALVLTEFFIHSPLHVTLSCECNYLCL